MTRVLNPPVLYFFIIHLDGIRYRFEQVLSAARYEREIIQYGLTLPPGWEIEQITRQDLTSGSADQKLSVLRKLPIHELDPVAELRLMANGYGRFDALKAVYDDHPTAHLVIGLPSRSAFKPYNDLVSEGILEPLMDTANQFSGAPVSQYCLSERGYKYACWLFTNVHTSKRSERTPENDREKKQQAPPERSPGGSAGKSSGGSSNRRKRGSA